MKLQTLIALSLFELYFTAVVIASGMFPDTIMLIANGLFAGWLAMEAMRVRLGHARGESRTLGILSRSFLIISFVSVALAFADYGLRKGATLFALPDSAPIAGALFLSVEVWLRHISISILGRFFVTKVQVRHDHQIVKDSIYSLLRHPSYTGLILGFIGITLILKSVVALAIFLALGIPAYLSTSLQ